MGSIKSFTGEKLIIGILSTIPEQQDKVEQFLREEFGGIDFRSRLLPFEFTNYYNPEMGKGIKKWFISFENLIDPSLLYDIKIRTNRIEKIFSIGGKRKMNLDPGMMSRNRFILATTKNNGHRVPLRQGIYAEVTLLFVNRKFQALPWTYADFRSEEYQHILLEIRQLYKNNLQDIEAAGKKSL